MVTVFVGRNPTYYMVGILMTYDFSAFRTNSPRQFRVLEANIKHLILLRERLSKGFHLREVYMVSHDNGVFTLYRAGQYDRGYRTPALLKSDEYAILQAKEIRPILAALGYAVTP